MLTGQINVADRDISIDLRGKDIAGLLNTEWLLSNSRGGFCSGSVIGCNTRRYHGLLTGTLNPPANRIVTLSNLRESLSVDGDEALLGNFEGVM